MLEYRLWLLDTRCPVDLLQINSLDSEQRHWMEPAEHPIALETANARFDADKSVLMQIDGILEQIDPLCLPATPSVLSLGRRCRAHAPVFVDPTGHDVPVETYEDVPYFRDTVNKQVRAKFRGPTLWRRRTHRRVTRGRRSPRKRSRRRHGRRGCARRI